MMLVPMASVGAASLRGEVIERQVSQLPPCTFEETELDGLHILAARIQQNLNTYDAAMPIRRLPQACQYRRVP
jgi:hypothetical protein